jgi:antitoxin component YwqK of YwqJK toxin-antitoxin module
MSAEYITEYYPNGNKHVQGYSDGSYPMGDFTLWYENGNKCWELLDVNYDASLFMSTSWYENGQIKQTGDAYSLFLNTGLWTNWYENGNKKSEGYYLGKHKSMLDFNESILEKDTFDCCDNFTGEYYNPRTGKWSYWHSNGQLACTGVHQEDGLWTFCDEKGNKVHERGYNYKNDEILTLWEKLKNDGCPDKLISKFKILIRE